jgi:hypothetical protein
MISSRRFRVTVSPSRPRGTYIATKRPNMLAARGQRAFLCQLASCNTLGNPKQLKPRAKNGAILRFRRQRNADYL